MSEWQLIKTAPKDGTGVLLYGLGIKDFPSAWNDKEPHVPMTVTAHWIEGWYDDYEDIGEGLFKKVRKCSYSYWKHSGSPHQFTPSHWMPLPEPPK